jgi:hypothetical protein
MRRLAHLAILPGLFMIFTEIGSRPERDTPVMIDVEGSEIRPATPVAANANPRIKTEIRTARGIYYGVSAPFEDVVKRMSEAPKVPNLTLDLRTPTAETCTPATATTPAIQVR